MASESFHENNDSVYFSFQPTSWFGWICSKKQRNSLCKKLRRFWSWFCAILLLNFYVVWLPTSRCINKCHQGGHRLRHATCWMNTKQNMEGGCGLVVSVLAHFSNDFSSNSALVLTSYFAISHILLHIWLYLPKLPGRRHWGCHSSVDSYVPSNQPISCALGLNPKHTIYIFPWFNWLILIPICLYTWSLDCEIEQKI